MAFRELVETECNGSNSLVNLTSHYVRDHGFKEEGIHQRFDQDKKFQTSEADQLVQQFLNEPACPQTFRMNILMDQMEKIEQGISHLPSTKSDVTNKHMIYLDVAWNDVCFDTMKGIPPISNLPVIQSEENQHFLAHDKPNLDVDPKWLDEYVDECLEQRMNAIVDKTNHVSNPTLMYSQFMKFMQQKNDIPLENDQQINLNDKTEGWAEQFLSNKQKMDDDITNNASDHAILNKVEEQLAAAGTWMDEYVKENAIAENNDAISESTWEQLNEMNEQWMNPMDAMLKEYEFCKTNPMKDLPNALKEGKQRLEAEDLPSAVLCFEAAVQQDESNIEAWLLLGKTQAENEQDPMAISALNRCLELDPSNSVALMKLAASYANESFQRQACLTLKTWLLKNEKYMHLSVSESTVNKIKQSYPTMSTVIFDETYEEVKDLYLQAARLNPRDGIDADVQCGLGILFNLCSDYEKAADCFRAALQMRPDDSRLWNKLGATLANGQRPAEAINVYHRALELSPGFIRARYNLGVSCVTLGAYKEAGEHLLTVLNQQAAGMGPQGSEAIHGAMSKSIWTTLRFVILFMNRYDLMKEVENRNLSALNKEFGIV